MLLVKVSVENWYFFRRTRNAGKLIAKDGAIVGGGRVNVPVELTSVFRLFPVCQFPLVLSARLSKQ